MFNASESKTQNKIPYWYMLINAYRFKLKQLMRSPF